LTKKKKGVYIEKGVTMLDCVSMDELVAEIRRRYPEFLGAYVEPKNSVDYKDLKERVNFIFGTNVFACQTMLRCIEEEVNEFTIHDKYAESLEGNEVEVDPKDFEDDDDDEIFS
jgi:hypothetical protein